MAFALLSAGAINQKKPLDAGIYYTNAKRFMQTF